MARNFKAPENLTRRELWILAQNLIQAATHFETNPSVAVRNTFYGDMIRTLIKSSREVDTRWDGKDEYMEVFLAGSVQLLSDIYWKVRKKEMSEAEGYLEANQVLEAQLKPRTDADGVEWPKKFMKPEPRAFEEFGGPVELAKANIALLYKNYHPKALNKLLEEEIEDGTDPKSFNHTDLDFEEFEVLKIMRVFETPWVISKKIRELVKPYFENETVLPVSESWNGNSWQEIPEKNL